ncbi:hypothetical protein [Halococcus thailandensis]|nr:hypothetical protein [Halococcus thailandensis]
MSDSQQQPSEAESPSESIQFTVACCGVTDVSGASACTYSGP